MWASCQIGIKVNAQNKAKQTVRIRCEGTNISYTCTFIYTLRDHWATPSLLDSYINGYAHFIYTYSYTIKHESTTRGL